MINKQIHYTLFTENPQRRKDALARLRYMNMNFSNVSKIAKNTVRKYVYSVCVNFSRLVTVALRRDTLKVAVSQFFVVGNGLSPTPVF